MKINKLTHLLIASMLLFSGNLAFAATPKKLPIAIQKEVQKAENDTVQIQKAVGKLLNNPASLTRVEAKVVADFLQRDVTSGPISKGSATMKKDAKHVISAANKFAATPSKENKKNMIEVVSVANRHENTPIKPTTSAPDFGTFHQLKPKTSAT